MVHLEHPLLDFCDVLSVFVCVCLCVCAGAFGKNDVLSVCRHIYPENARPRKLAVSFLRACAFEIHMDMSQKQF